VTDLAVGVNKVFISYNDICRSFGYGFVEFNSHEDQERALTEKGSNFQIQGRTVTLNPAIENSVRSEGTGRNTESEITQTSSGNLEAAEGSK
jgi:RNA recognition motif-containing protein